MKIIKAIVLINFIIIAVINNYVSGQVKSSLPFLKVNNNILIEGGKEYSVSGISPRNINSDEVWPDIDFWYEVGAGLSFSDDYYLQYHSLGLNYDKKYLVSLRFAVNSNNFYDLSALYHVNYSGRFGMLSAGTGAGMLWGEYNKENFTTPGIPVEFKAFFTPIRYFGIGLCVISNINAKVTKIYGNINFRFGILY